MFVDEDGVIRVQSLRKNVWSALLTLLGLNLWALMCLMPLGVEWAAQDTRRLCVFVYLLPLIFLSVGLLVRWAGLLLLLFPASFLPVYLVLPEADRGIHETAVGWLTLAVSVVMYVCVAAMWSRENPPLLFARSGRVSLSQRRSGSDLVAESIGQPPLGRHLWWPYRWYFLPRWCFLFLLVVVPFYGLNFSEGVADVYAAGFGSQADHARVMANLIFVFVWVVLAYLFFFSPGLNLELEQRELDVSFQRLEDRAKKHPLRRLLFLVFVAGLALLTFWIFG